MTARHSSDPASPRRAFRMRLRLTELDLDRLAAIQNKANAVQLTTAFTLILSLTQTSTPVVGLQSGARAHPEFAQLRQHTSSDQVVRETQALAAELVELDDV